MAWDAVIFDCDGVLVDSELLANQVLSDLLGRLGHPRTVAECVDSYLGGSIGRVRRLIEEEGGFLPGDFEDRYQAGVFDAFRDRLTAVPGVVEVLDGLRVPVAVASSGSPERIALALGLTGLADRFGRHVYSADQVERGKPAPDLFLLAARSLDAAPARTAVIEDSPLGVTAARRAGMTAFGYAALTPADRLGEAAVVVVDMADLPAQLDRLAPA